MSKYRVPLEKPKPDIERFIKIMEGKIIPDKPPMVEYLIDNALMKPILEDMLGRKWVATSDKIDYMGGQMDFSKENIEDINAWLDNLIEFWYHMGYDFVRMEASLALPAKSSKVNDTAGEGLTRAWQDETEGVIKTWEDFEKYPWPKIKEEDFYIHRYICGHLPEGMGFISCHAGGVYEHLSRLMSYEHLCLTLIDDPKLFKAVTDKIGSLIYEYDKHLLELDELTTILQGDDFAFNTQTLIAPDDIRKYFLPWHKKYAELCHEKGKPYYLHSCGKVDDLMDDFIDYVKIDGKHSFQDGAASIIDAKKKWGKQICLLGGVDMDKLSRMEPDNLRKYIRNIIEECAPGGRFAIGAGNSIPSYIPLENYLTMLDESLK
jgi:uroporphyrinogen decarboxylase